MKFREINIKDGMPTVNEACKILEQEFSRARHSKIGVLKIIHGYGSSGVGGKIRSAVKKILIEKKAKNEICEYIFGDVWSIFNETTRLVISKCPELSRDSDLDRFNIGISFVIIKKLN